uniref:Uncharacterized protein n=1 Tax=Ditylenchus dipsaci TaxID=166011 RepID=A0A915EIL7_9BILA
MSNRNAPTTAAQKGKSLVIKGTGYASPINSSGQQTSSSSTRTSVRRTAQFNGSSSMRRAGSVGNVTASFSSSNRVPLVPQASSSSYASSRAIRCNNNGSASTEHSATDHGTTHRESSPYIYSGTGGRKRVEFMEERGHMVNGGAKYPSLAEAYEPATDTIGSIDASTSTQKQYKRIQQQQQEGRQRFQDEDLFLKLEQAFQNEHILEERLKSQMAENRKLSMAKADLEDRLHSIEGKMSKERRSLMEDGVELQRRLDELTPLLAEKEARIAKLENEREELGDRLRSANLKISSIQARMDERKREESLYSELDSDRKQEIERLRQKLRIMEKTLEEHQSSKDSVTDELNTLRQRLKEEESTARHERALYEKSTQENTELARDNSELNSRIRHLESQLEHQQQDLSARRKTETHEREVEQLRHIEKSLRAELQMAEERVKREQDKLRAITTQERERMTKEEEYRETRTRIQQELEALQALSHSLASENKGLREERIATDERLHFLQSKLVSKENDILDLTERLEDFKRKYIETSNRLRLEITRFSESYCSWRDTLASTQIEEKKLSSTASQEPSLSQKRANLESAENLPPAIHCRSVDSCYRCMHPSVCFNPGFSGLSKERLTIESSFSQRLSVIASLIARRQFHLDGPLEVLPRPMDVEAAGASFTSKL